MKKLLKENRKKINAELTTAEGRSFFSPALRGLYMNIKLVIEEYAQGNLLDAGCGDMPYKSLVLDRVESYDTLDVEVRTEGVKYIGSIDDMHMIEAQAYDTVLCFEVLEHIKNPAGAVNEMKRVLKKDGAVIISVPHLSRLHEAPNDYYRYTEYGLKTLFEENGFEIVKMQTTGSVFSFLGHQFSSFFVCLFWGVPVLKWLAFFLNKWLCVLPCYYLDKILLKNSLLPLGYVCVARKREE